MTKPTTTPPLQTPAFTMDAEQKQQFLDAAYTRAYRQKPDILIVEDQHFSLQLLCSALRREHKLYTAGNARDAWQLYLEHAPDVVLLDVEMPEISGHALAAHLCQFDPKAFVVMVTANNFLEDVERSKKNGAQGFIAKPYSKQKILDVMQKFNQHKKSR
jgi:two-component system, chemotaxis family, chemotaxis protein CheY